MDNNAMMYQVNNQGYANQYSQPVQQQNTKPKPKSGYSYPEQLWFQKNAKQGFFIDDHLCYPEAKEYEPNGGKLQPLSIHGKFSKFKFSILNYEHNRSASININPGKIKSLELKTIAAENIRMNRLAKGSGEGNAQSPAYTQNILGGDSRIKGKTPAQALMENPTVNIDLLTKQYQYLAANVGKFKSNQAQMDAITDAFNLYNAGQLKPTELPLIIYTDCKIPNKIPDANGYVDYVSCEINCNFNMNYPIKIEIVNTKVKLDQNGSPNMKECANTIRYEFQMSLEDWSDAVETMMCLKESFEAQGRLERHLTAKKCAAINAGRA